MYHNQPVKGLYPSQASFYTCSRLILVIHVYILQGYSYRLISLIQKSYYNSVFDLIKPRIALPREGGGGMSIFHIFLHYLDDSMFLNAVDNINLIRLSWLVSLAPGS